METPNISVLDNTVSAALMCACGWRGNASDLKRNPLGIGSQQLHRCPTCNQAGGLSLDVYAGQSKLNLGCSDAHKGAGWTNVDICQPCDVQADLTQGWPWADSSVSEIAAWDIFEHLPSIIHTMNEAHRVLKAFGTLDLVVPTTTGNGAFQDPTHKSFWNENTLLYFVEDYAEWQRFHVSYGISAHFVVKNVEHKLFPQNVWKLHAELVAVKA